MNKILLTFLLASFSTLAAAERAFSSLEEQMNSKEFESAGLEKLSPEELEVLNNWIRGRSLVALDKAKPTTSSGDDNRGLETNIQKKMSRDTINSRLVGTFKGWDGHTTFKLENGMVWQQSDKDKFYTKEVSNPVMTIKSGALKTWRLSVEGYGSSCKVKRIQ